MRSKTITFAHFKGGTGKTTSCMSIAGFLAKNDANVLAVDLDPQSNLTKGLGIDNSHLKASMCHVMAKRNNIRDIIVDTSIPNLKIAPANPYLVHTALKKYKHRSDAFILDDALKAVKNDYDFILVDTPPSSGHFIVNGVTAADSTVLVLDPGVFSLHGIETFNRVFKSYCSRVGFKLDVSMALVTKYQRQLNPFKRNIGKEIKAAAEEILDKKIFFIPYSDHIYESHLRCIPISHYKPESSVGVAYMNVTEELMKTLKD